MVVKHLDNDILPTILPRCSHYFFHIKGINNSPTVLQVSLFSSFFYIYKLTNFKYILNILHKGAEMREIEVLKSKSKVVI